MNRHGLNLQNRPRLEPARLTVSLRPEQMQEIVVRQERDATYWRQRCAEGESSALRLFLVLVLMLRLYPAFALVGVSGD